MRPDSDHYEAYYADKLWQLLPEVYRADDTDDPDTRGPLRELVARIGVQAAILRRSIDRLWDDQSIETSDDWVIPYIAQLLATNLVSAQDARGQRIDVAKTIYYRRRKGTVAVLEEIAGDIAGWEARVVEFFRRLGRSRHGLDPEIGWPQEAEQPNDAYSLQVAEGLTGPLTQSTIGGTADLRHAYGGSLTHGAFDEYFHTVDLRRGRGNVGWYNISRFGVFLWRLYSFEVPETTPVPVKDCAGHFTFDPTGRTLPLFAANSRSKVGFSAWVSPQEWEMPTPIRKPLLEENTSDLYPRSLAIQHQGSQVDDLTNVRIHPEIGRFFTDPAAWPGRITTTYHYGFSSTIGAGPFDRRLLKRARLPAPQPETTISGGSGLDAALGALPSTASLTIADSLTYASISDLAAVQEVTIRAAERQRPLVRMDGIPAADWQFTGIPGATLILDGLFVSGGDLILAGEFDRVRFSCCTLDPGTAGEPPNVYRKSVDDRDLRPTRLIVTGSVRELIVDRSIVGPIVEQGSGQIEKLTITDSIAQAVANEDAIQIRRGLAELSRVTLLGRANLHRLEANECILGEDIQVRNTQDGCVRFSAWCSGSRIPRKYECVEIPPAASLFTSREFGQPGYCQLLETADRSIVHAQHRATVSEGAEDDSEMGAFAREKNPIKRRSLAIKFEEYMPLGLVPVFIPVT